MTETPRASPHLHDGADAGLGAGLLDLDEHAALAARAVLNECLRVVQTAGAGLALVGTVLSATG